MRKAMIYPFQLGVSPLTLYFSKFQPEYSISALVSPVGLGIIWAHTVLRSQSHWRKWFACAMWNRGCTEAMWCAYCAIWWLQEWSLIYNAIDVIHCAVAMGKEIFCCLPLRKPQRKEIENACQIYGATWHNGFQESFNIFNRISYGNYKAHVPVVLFMI